MYSVTSEDDQINVIDEILAKDVNNLKYDNFGYDIKNISSLTLDEIYNKPAPVLRKIIDCLTQNNQSSENNEMCQKRKLRKCLAIDLLISAKNLRYISPLSLAPMLLLYNATGSKTAVEIFSHTLPSGGYTFLQNWLLELKPDISISGKSESDLIYAFDNNQRLQKVWLSRNANKQTLEVMTNIIKLELTGYNNQKLSNLHPNLWRKFSHLDFSDNIFFPTKDEVNNSLRKAFESVLGFTEKDDIVQIKIAEEEVKSKCIQCKQCKKIYNKKKIKCDDCKINIRHGTLGKDPVFTRVAPLKREKGLKFNVVSEEVDDTGVKKLGCEYIGVSRSSTSSDHPLFSEKSTSVDKTSCPKICLLEPVFVNPASKSPLKVVLDKIASDAGINSGYRRFVYIVCDGSPMTLVWQLILEDPQNYSWVIPITGLGHEEMNMVKSFTEMFYDFILKSFFETQGYTTQKHWPLLKGVQTTTLLLII